ncbi:WhiB family transcriptional regulator [Microbacterium foliorum]|uniref:WhiB family transcriptional regulator n=1 Tax=Microbacterium foliorum TaxID=104336 RepID=UPI0037C8A86B
MFAEDAYDHLEAAIRDNTPPCSGLHLFTADSRTDEQRAACSSICARCPITDLCGAYATAAKADFGFWAGVDRAARGRGRPRASTTDAEAVPSAPINRRNTP